MIFLARAIVIALAFFAFPVQGAEVPYSGAELQSPCSALASGAVVGDKNTAAYAGICAGIVHVLMVTGAHFQEKMRSCAPGAANVVQGAKVLSAYLSRHPERLHQPVVILAIDAFREAWPCR